MQLEILLTISDFWRQTWLSNIEFRVADSDTLQSPAIQASTSMCGRTVKEYEEQLRVLKKENFNLKLRIYFLEERMTRRPGPAGDAEENAERKLIELKVCPWVPESDQ